MSVIFIEIVIYPHSQMPKRLCESIFDAILSKRKTITLGHPTSLIFVKSSDFQEYCKFLCKKS